MIKYFQHFFVNNLKLLSILTLKVQKKFHMLYIFEHFFLKFDKKILLISHFLLTFFKLNVDSERKIVCIIKK